MMRRWAVWAALVCTLLACWWVEQADQPSQVVATSDKARVQQRKTLAQVLPAIKVNQQTASSTLKPTVIVDEPIVNLFSAMAVPGSEVTESQVQAPINPYTYAGRLQEDGRWVVFLTDGQQQYVLHEGEKFAEGWQVAVLDQQKIVLQHATGRFEIRLDNGVVF